MLSRVTSLDGLLILRPFEKKKIQCRQSEDLRTDMKRLEKLRLQTIRTTGNDQEREEAEKIEMNMITSHNGEQSLTPQRPKKVRLILRPDTTIHEPTSNQEMTSEHNNPIDTDKPETFPPQSLMIQRPQKRKLNRNEDRTTRPKRRRI